MSEGAQRDGDGHPFSVQDLTVIIPTIGRGPLLVRLVEHLVRVCHVNRIIIVWDSGEPIPHDLAQLPEEALVIRHDRNRGLSAARNTGFRALQTRLGMFIDDDILPCQNMAEAVVEFHNNFPGPLVFGMGGVTWEGTGIENVLTRWFETLGNWSIFGKMVPGQKYPFFMGGFTSFKSAVRDVVLFDESFTRYGCEDVEFGFRLFSAGGELRMVEKLNGLHYSDMNVGIYTRNHLGAGYSKGGMFCRHPDAAFSPEYFLRFLRMYAGKKCVVDAANIMSTLLSMPGVTPEDINPCMQFLTDAAMAEGLEDYCREHYSGFAAAVASITAPGPQQWKDRLGAALDACPNHPILWLLHAEAAQADGDDWRPSLWRCVALAPLYVEPLLRLLAGGGEDGTRAEARLRQLWTEFRLVMAPDAAKRIAAALGSVGGDGGADSSTREMFFELRRLISEEKEEAAIELGYAILGREISHVGAALALAEMLADRQENLSKVFCAMAENFVKFRPLHEHAGVQNRIQKLKSQMGLVL